MVYTKILWVNKWMREEEIVWPKCYNIKQLTSDTMTIKWYCNQTINHVQLYSRNLEEQYRLRIKYSKGSQRQWLIHVTNE